MTPPPDLTPNLGLVKPGPADRVDIAVLNGNADLIDAAVGGLDVRPRSYRHEQVEPADEWIIEHDLGYRPAGVIVVDSAGTMVEGAITENTETTTVLAFEAPFAGVADLS
jgi:hypothetical protein